MLILRSDNGDFDLFGNEDIVQTLAIFNLEDISARSGEYTPLFNLPLTNNNIRLIEYATFINSVNTAPFKKIPIKLIIDGMDCKLGFLAIDSVTDTIKARFYSGNSNFYDLLKSLYLTDLDWSTYNHIWNYTNAVSSSSNTSGYIYPVMTYNGQILSGDIVDVRKILPATYNRTILNKILSELGYTSDLNFDTSDLDVSLLPYAKKNPTLTPEVLLLNSVDVYRTENYIVPTYTHVIIPGYPNFYNTIFKSSEFTDIGTTGSSQYYDFINKKFTVQYSGTYSINALLELDDYDLGLVGTFNATNVVYYRFNCNIYIQVLKRYNGTSSVVKNELIGTIGAGYNNTASPVSSIVSFTGAYVNNTTSVDVYLNSGDELYVGLYVAFTCDVASNGTNPVKTYLTFNPIILDTATLTIDLEPELVFGQLIPYSTILPKIKCNDFIKDICIRFGLLFSVNEDAKHIIINKLDTIIDNIPNAINWSDKLDDSELPEINFKYDSYAQINHFKHKEDKTVTNTDIGTDYILNINNQNLELEKTIYTSPFAPCENVDFNGTTTAIIGLYNTTNSKFDIDVQPRICFSEAVIGAFKFTDGTTTSGYINTRRIWFIDNALPDLSMGFGTNLITKNSQYLITTLQDLRLVKANFNLKIIDIKDFDFFTPIYIEQYQAYFFVSSINQFNYTRPDLTEVELIKLNQ
jgi:hypothetical protein